jgi:hypothetical protein
MKNLIRFGIALAICLSGWALAPVVDLPKVAFGWERYADAYSLIHRSVIPAAAVASGAAGAFFQTDVDINNTASAGTAQYEFWWLPRGADNSNPVHSDIFTLDGGRSVRIENVLTEVFGFQPDQVGALVIASDSDTLIAQSRTYNIPGAKVAGTFGQALPAVPADELIGAGDTRRIIFMSEDTAFRANVGCVNGTDAPVNILLDLYDAEGTALETQAMNLGPWSNNQINRIFRNHQPVSGYVEVHSDTSGAAYYCYGSVLDNVTSDPTTILPQTPSTGITYYIPAAALAAGSAGAFFQTDVDINNTGSATSYTFTWLPRGEDNSSPLQSGEYTLDAGMSTRFENVLSEVFSLQPDAAGAVGIQSSSNDLLAMSRTYNLPGGPSGGTFGQALPGIQEGDLTRAGERRRIIFLSQNAELRANVGCINATAEDITIDIEIYGDTGALLGTRQMELRAGSNDQINRILQPYAPTNGYVDVSSDTTGALFYCYGSVLDSQTSDPTTILPQ